jgi:RNA-directed DNA polymerase
MNEFDRYVKHVLKVNYYLRYGDDFIIFADNFEKLREQRKLAINFLRDQLKLTINDKNDIIVKTKLSIHFLGVEIFPKGRRLSKRNWNRIIGRMNEENYASYWGLSRKHCNLKKRKFLGWKATEMFRG